MSEKQIEEKPVRVSRTSRTDRSVPEFCLRNMGLRTTRQFKSKKRKQFKAVIKAMDAFDDGCFFVPGYEEISKINDSLRSIRRKISVTSWGK